MYCMDKSFRPYHLFFEFRCFQSLWHRCIRCSHTFCPYKYLWKSELILKSSPVFVWVRVLQWVIFWTVSSMTSKWKCLGPTANQPHTVRPCKVAVLSHMVCKSHQDIADSVASKVWTSSGMNISTNTASLELQGMGFHGWGAACTPYFTKHNAKCRMDCCKAPLDFGVVEMCSVERQIMFIYLAIWWIDWFGEYPGTLPLQLCHT